MAASAQERLGPGDACAYLCPMQDLEERLAHLIRLTDDLSDEVARQAKEIDVLNRRVAMLMQREAEREAGSGDAVVFGDERPPHY